VFVLRQIQVFQRLLITCHLKWDHLVPRFSILIYSYTMEHFGSTCLSLATDISTCESVWEKQHMTYS